MIKLSDDSPTNDGHRPDSRDVHKDNLIGTPLRDAAVDPRDTDFLAPINAGQADPHGPEVVSPEIHASQGVRPVKAGKVHVDDPSAQEAAETAHAVTVQTDGATAVTTEDGRPAGNASREEWEAYALANGKTPEDLDGLGRDGIRDQFKETTE